MRVGTILIGLSLLGGREFGKVKGSEIGVQKEELEGTVGESFGSDESMVPDDTIELCAFESPLPATVISE